MKILHTSDVHLAQGRPERLEALDAVLDVATGLDVDVLVVGGDLFDSDADAAAMRPELRDRFSGAGFDVVLVSGNHDRHSYREGLYYGDRARGYGGDRPVALDIGPCRLVAQPYTDIPFDRLAPDLEEMARDHEFAILVMHCTLDFPDLEPESFGEEGGGRYLPVSSAALRELGYRVVLAGHFHRFRQQDIGDDCRFVYPGSPVSVTSAETGRRAACLLDLGTGALERVHLDTFHHVAVTATLVPGGVKAGLDRLVGDLESQQHPLASLRAEISGFVDVPEDVVGSRIRDIRDRWPGIEIRERYRDAVSAVEHPLYRKFEQRLEGGDLPETGRERLRAEMLRVLADHLAAGR